MSITSRERDTLLKFIERNVSVAPNNLDEGIGTVYERVVIDDYFRALQAELQIESVLENPADGVTGVPGINSMEFARNGGTVWLANPSRKMLDNARQIWVRQGLVEQARFVQCEYDDTGLPADAYDLVWNYCMFERFRDPSSLVAEMKRVSRRYVLIMTQNVSNFGTPVHTLYHALGNLDWDHGYGGQMTFGAIRRALLAQGLEIEHEGTVDIPPWLDTWDMPLRGALKELLGHVGKKWEWKIDTQGMGGPATVPWSLRIVRSIEQTLPEWFRRFQAHHLYILARK
ncbi:MAG TPA: methyltransferase domain-containing protein [Chloroflexota bacterium]|nr:methyltransferase domain-containing protein [Chloroflexota bacterium]